jgi:hypothetical protein
VVAYLFHTAGYQFTYLRPGIRQIILTSPNNLNDPPRHLAIPPLSKLHLSTLDIERTILDYHHACQYWRTIAALVCLEMEDA